MNNVPDAIYSVLRTLLRPIVKIIWIKEISGLENIPKKGSAVLAINHQSYFDFFCLAVVSPRNIHFLAAEKFFNHWLWGILMKVTRQVRVDRNTHDKHEMHNLVHAHIDRGSLVGIFPEGTRSPYEHTMLKAFSGIAKYALHKKIPIIPVGIKGTFHVMSKTDHRPKLLKIVLIHVGPPIHYKEYYTRSEYSEMDYRVITHSVMKKISVLSGKNYDHDL